jgi:hypothetical protein
MRVELGSIRAWRVRLWWLQCTGWISAVSFAGDEHPAGALGPCRACEPLGDRVHPGSLWCSCYHFDPAGGEDRVERGGELGIPVPGQVGEPAPGVGQVGGASAGQLRGPGRGREPGGARQMYAPRVVLGHERHVQPGQRQGAVGMEEVAARIVAACARGKVRQRSSRTCEGGIRWERKILRMVPAPVRCPRRRSSPWIRTTPRRGLSRASLTISPASSPASGGRPGALGWSTSDDGAGAGCCEHGG